MMPMSTKSIDDIAAEQGIKAPQRLDTLIGAGADLWEDDLDLERFLESIDQVTRV